MKKISSFIALCAGIVLIFTGCNVTSRPSTATIKGKVTLPSVTGSPGACTVQAYVNGSAVNGGVAGVVEGSYNIIFTTPTVADLDTAVEVTVKAAYSAAGKSYVATVSKLNVPSTTSSLTIDIPQSAFKLVFDQNDGILLPTQSPTGGMIKPPQ